jgi:hypothetical protein
MTKDTTILNGSDLQSQINQELKTDYELARAATSTEGGRKAIDFFYHVHLNNWPGFASALIRKDREGTARAYGGCTDCHGKGYATVRSFTSGRDTDWDIGGRGEVAHYQNPVMKFCVCPRGEQLKGLVAAPTGEGRTLH